MEKTNGKDTSGTNTAERVGHSVLLMTDLLSSHSDTNSHMSRDYHNSINEFTWADMWLQITSNLF